MASVIEKPRRLLEPRCGSWREVAIGAIKAVHSAIFLLNAASILHICWVGVMNRRSRWTRVALVAALTEVFVFLVNRGRCPLTQMVEAMGAENGRVSDIFLPRWFADRIPQLFGPPLVLGLLGLAYHRVRGPATSSPHLMSTPQGTQDLPGRMGATTPPCRAARPSWRHAED